MAESKIKNLSVDVGFVKIHLPDHTMSSFMIAQSLGEEFGVETNYDALKKIRAVLRNSDSELYKNVKTDCESGCVFIHASSKRAEEILRVAILINENAIEPYQVRIDDDYIDKVKQVLMSWKRPKPQKWKVGDVFSIGLCDSTFAFGQVVWERYKAPNCALFDFRSRDIIIPLEDIISSPVISVLKLGSMCLDSFEWKVIGNTPVNILKKQVPLLHRGEVVVGARSYSAGVLSDLAEAYYGLQPWNASLSNDELLMPKIERPKSAFFLTNEQLEEYYKTKGWK
jgi:hypothetical protein